MGEIGLIPEFSFEKSFASTRHLDALLGDAEPLSVVPTPTHTARGLIGSRPEGGIYSENNKRYQNYMQVSVDWDRVLWCGTLVFSVKITVTFHMRIVEE